MKIFKRGTAGKILTITVVVSMICCLTLFSSCIATVRTPRHASSGIIIESERHDNGNHYGEKKHKRFKER